MHVKNSLFPHEQITEFSFRMYDKVSQTVMQMTGLENVEQGCCATGMFEMSYLCNEKNPLTCPDADKYFFWDSFHPTEKVNRFFANSTLQICLRELLS